MIQVHIGIHVMVCVIIPFAYNGMQCVDVDEEMSGMEEKVIARLCF